MHLLVHAADIVSALPFAPPPSPAPTGAAGATSALPTDLSALPSWVKVTGIAAVVLFIIAIVGSVQGIKVMNKANKGTISQSATVGANVLIGVAIIVVCWGLVIVGVVVTTIGAVIST